MTAIAADMVDGFLNGSGAKGANSKISAVFNVVAGQVLVEALSNNLKVGGIVATNLIDQAIATTRPGIKSSQMTDNVRITAGMLEQTRDALIAAQILDSSDRVAAIVNTVNAIAADSLPADIEAVLPADTSASLDYAVIQSSTASAADMLAINQVFTNAGDSGGTVSSGTGTTDPVNTAPVISGTPAGSVLANSSYLFQPSATDADGDALTFSITNKPVWAGFSKTSGQLSGTPGDTDVGTFGNIVISVSDRIDTVSLPAFSIRVDEVPVAQTGSFSLSWTAPVARADGTPLSLADIAGFRIYYGDSAGSYPHSLNIADGTVQAATVTDVPSGTYHVVMTTYDVDGRESGYSADITKTAQ
jgi:hypothetical protein